MDYIAAPSAESDTYSLWMIVGIPAGTTIAVMVIILIGYTYYQRSRLQLSPADSEMLGVSLAYLLDDFENDAEDAAQKVMQNEDRYKSDLTTHVNPNFYDIKDAMACSEDAVGKDKVCPRDGQYDCSIVDAFWCCRDGSAGAANQFLSWAWGYRVQTFKSGLRAWSKSVDQIDPRTVFFWICFFWCLPQMHCLSTNLILCRCSNNQFRLSANDDEDLFTTFRTRLQRIGNVVALLDTWKCPYYLSRKWCKFGTRVPFLLFGLTWNLTQLFGNAGIYEVYEQQRLNDMDEKMKDKMRLTFTLPEDQAEDLRKTLQTDEGFKQVGLVIFCSLRGVVTPLYRWRKSYLT